MGNDTLSQITFENMLSFMFPGFFAALSLFMALEILSPFHLTNYVASDLTSLISFYGILLLGGTIIGVVIDGIHHRFIEPIFFHSNEKNEAGITLGNLVEFHKAHICDKQSDKICKKCKFKDEHINYDAVSQKFI